MATPDLPDDAYKTWDAFIASALSHAESQLGDLQFISSRLADASSEQIQVSRRGLRISAALIVRVGWALFLLLCSLLAGGYLVPKQA